MDHFTSRLYTLYYIKIVVFGILDILETYCYIFIYFMLIFTSSSQVNPLLIVRCNVSKYSSTLSIFVILYSTFNCFQV